MSTPKVQDISLVDFNARCLVNGTRKHERSGRFEPISGEWSSRFAGHPWVQASEKEGWGRELRAAVIAEVKRRMLSDEPFDQIEVLMPSKIWIENARKRAVVEAEAAEWRARIIAEHGSVDAFLMKTAKGNNANSGPWKKIGDAA
jgi:hypothetical protein